MPMEKSLSVGKEEGRGLYMNEKMPAVLNFAPEPFSVELREIPVPEIGENDVLLAVEAVGI